MDKVRFGIVGLGSMGAKYARMLTDGSVARAELAAVCNRREEPMKAFPAAAPFTDYRDMCRSGRVDAVLIATPHYAHTPVGIAALEAGLHVLVDKPVSVDKADAGRLLAAHRNPAQVFSAMFQMRTEPRFRRVKEMVSGGDLGRVQRFQWTITDWFRTDCYYRSGGWRATWKGEGGGVLLNQAPHQLDLLTWFFGMPERVRAWCHFGKYHAIEVEDEVTAHLEYGGGLTGVFITSTGEAPGTNRLEVAGENGRMVLEGHRLSFDRTDMPASRFRAESREMFAQPGVTRGETVFEPAPSPHRALLADFISAVIDGTPPVAPASEGLLSVELANAMILSAVEGREVDLPLDAARYRRWLDGRTGAGADQSP